MSHVNRVYKLQYDVVISAIIITQSHNFNFAMQDWSDSDCDDPLPTDEVQMSPNHRYWKYLKDRQLLAPSKVFGDGDPLKHGNLLDKLLDAASAPRPSRVRNAIDPEDPDREGDSPSLKRRRLLDELQQAQDRENPFRISHIWAPDEFIAGPPLPWEHYLQDTGEYECFKMTVFPPLCSNEKQVETVVLNIRAIRFSPKYECQYYEYR